MILSITLAIFLVVSIIFVIKLIKLTKDIHQVVLTGQKIADDVESVTDSAADIAKNAKKMSTISGIVSSVNEAYNAFKKGKKS
jgi:uncharacterized protein YoxC